FLATICSKQMHGRPSQSFALGGPRVHLRLFDCPPTEYRQLYQPSKRLTHYGPVAIANGGDASGLGREAAPSVLAGIENGLVARKHAIGEEVLAQILPDVFLCVELRALGRQR